VNLVNLIRRSLLATGVIGVATVVVARSGAAPAICPASPFRSSPPVVIAHASGSHFGPPNTIEMMLASFAAGADVIDADVRMTADGILVAAHDDVVTVGLSRRSISRSTLADLRTLDLGDSWPGPDHRYRLRGAGVRIPTVADVLRAFPRQRLSIELKVGGTGRALCEVLRANGRTRDVYVGSAGDAGVDEVERHCPEVVTTVTDAIVVEMRRARETGAAWCSPAPIGQPSLRRGDRRLDAVRVRWSHDHGMAVYTWTADDTPTLRHAISLGVDGIYTARPDLARRLLGPTRTA
jgi:glycerophosphoryl diester phosphodiesterase